MKFRRVLLLGALSAAGLTGLIFSIFPRARAMSHRHRGTVAQMHQGRHGVRQFCQHENMTDHIDMVGRVVETRLDLNTDQIASLNQIKDSLKANGETFQSLCSDFDDQSAAPDKLAQLETVITTGLTAVQEIQEPFNAFYNSLSSEQQNTLNEAISSRRSQSRTVRQ